jgi:hypothetical protein
MIPGIPEGPPDPSNLITLLAGLRLATTLLNWSFAIGISEVDVCVLQLGYGGIYRCQVLFPPP